jgi:hypothetical protein
VAGPGTPVAFSFAVRHAQRISGRDAFAARVAFEVVGESARTELDSLMAEWRRFPDPEVIETVKRRYNDAGKQVEALHTNGKLDAARVGWAASSASPIPASTAYACRSPRLSAVTTPRAPPSSR